MKSIITPERSVQGSKNFAVVFHDESASSHPPAVLFISPLPYIITQQFSQFLITYFDNPYRNNDCSENYGV
jgi:hypothetical protein